MIEIFDAAVEAVANDAVWMLDLEIWPSAELERGVDTDQGRVSGSQWDDLARSTILQWSLFSLRLDDDGGITAIDHESHFLSSSVGST